MMARDDAARRLSAPYRAATNVKTSLPRHVSPENLPRDDPLLNFVGPFVDLADFSVTVDRFEWPVLIGARH